jgi:S-adenosylmethionine/arginine decarboxylase-like enzyme
MNNRAWGLSCAFDFNEADKRKISNPSTVKQFIKELCDAIKMKMYGETWIEKFASHDEKLFGITVLQAIETSSITAHFAENIGEIYLDVFSCAEYDPQVVLNFTEKFFLCKGKIINNSERGVSF